jgi:hypothetical protein
MRTVSVLPEGVTLQDIDSDGRVLLILHSERLALGAGTLGSNEDKDLSWHDWNVAKDISPDGQSVLFEDSSAAASGYSVVLRKLDGTPPILLGKGTAGGLSPDGKWAISISVSDPEQVTLLPIGAGQPRPISQNLLEHIQTGWGRFLPDGRSILVNGNEAGHGRRCYQMDVNGATPRAVTPEGTRCGPASPDGRFLIGVSPSRELAIYPIGGGSPRQIPGLEPGFIPSQWSENSVLYGYQEGELPAKIYKVDPTTGKRSVVQQLHPAAPAGVVIVTPIVVSRDGKRFAYSYNKTSSMLEIAEDLR